MVGLHDDRVEGVSKLGRGVNELQQAAIDRTVPTVAARSWLLACGGEEHLLIFEIRPAAGVVDANVRDEVFLRVGDENRRLTFAQGQELMFDRGRDSLTRLVRRRPRSTWSTKSFSRGA